MSEFLDKTDDNSVNRLEELNGKFDEVFSAEISQWVSKLRDLRNLRKKIKNPKPLESPDHPDPRNELVGLAMSGGGTRSATFNLGVTQAFAQYGLMSEVDYMSTISGGGYIGGSFSTLCADDSDTGSGADANRLGMGVDNFPYAIPNPFPESLSDSEANRPSPVVHALESPATRHVRENARLLIPGTGIFSRDAWVTVSRYALSTVLLWLLFLLPMATAILLPTILIPEAIWNRSDPFSVGPFDRGFSFSNQPWLIVIPLALLAISAGLALLPGRKRVGERELWRAVIEFAQNVSILGMIVTAAGAFLVLGLWAYSSVVDSTSEWGLGVIGAGSAGTAFISLRATLNLPEGLRQKIMDLIFSLFGYVVLGFGLIAWYYFLWNGWEVTGGWQGFRHSLDEYWVAWAAVGAVLAISSAFAPWLLNHLSINRLYEERLQRTWFVSPVFKPGRPNAGWTQVRENSKLKIGDLIPEFQNDWPITPYPLVCTAVNMSGSTNPKLLNRRADSFIIAPSYSGSPVTGWAPTSSIGAINKMSLARASAISAAAFSPNMGRKTSTTLSVLTTLFNARLGWWIPNPTPIHWLDRLTFPLAVLYWMELFGKASHEGDYVYLSDGGHFENMGIYELMRRRCKYIIAIDGTGEPTEGNALNFSGLGLCLRRARIDFGVLVDINLGPMMRDPKSGHVKSYYSVGEIRYPNNKGNGKDGDDDTGILLYIKSGLVDGTIPPDILQYHRAVNPDFPHDPTADQQFDEPQFESYRELGFLAGLAASRATRGVQDVAKRFESMREAFQRDFPVRGEKQNDSPDL